MPKHTRRHINFRQTFRVIGWLLMIESGFMLIPLAVAAYHKESDLWAFAIAAGATALAGLSLTFSLRNSEPSMSKREGFLLTALVWIVFSIFGMIPFMLCNNHFDISSAFFEAMSGFTTTGFSTYESVESYSHAINLWRTLMQWIGGMGIILFTLAVIPMLNHSGGMQMFNAEVTGITHDKIRPRVSQTAKSLWGLYFFLTAALALLLWMGPMSLYDAVCHSFSAISTGGFSTRDASLAAFQSDYVTIVTMIFMFLGGTSFALIYKALQGKPMTLLRNNVFRAYIAIIGVVFICIVANIIVRGQVNDWRDVTIYPLFQVISTITSTGLSVCNFSTWGPFAIALMMVLMFTGACAGSTSGGAKIDRMILMVKSSRNELYRCIHPNAITSVRINQNIVSPDLVSKVIAFFCIYILVIVVGAISLCAIGMPLLESLFSAFSCVCNTGFSADITSLSANFSPIPSAGKWILSALMLIGRLELFTVLILFTRGFWRK